MRPVRLEDRAALQRYFETYPQRVCEMCFSQMFLWGESRNHLFTEVEGHLVICFQKRNETRKWYPPIGPEPERIIRDLLPPSRGYIFLYIDEPLAQKLQGLGLTLKEEPTRFDYVYSLEGLRTLVGSKYASKRNLIKKCLPFDPDVVPLNGLLHEECVSVLDRWMESEERPGMNSALDEISSLHLAMKNFEALKLLGVGIRIKGRLEAFAIGNALNPTMFLEQFEHANKAFIGLYPLVLHEFVKAVPLQYTELNREEDLGIPGLRTAKECWHPLYLVKKYSIAAS
ncbi:DUF2156 domain-containing protein [Candidatus Peregrinibacteria bacterium]|nr:DUF2156 domain-containing protein [Candidatus Peregrinibacteria bacterium]